MRNAPEVSMVSPISPASSGDSGGEDIWVEVVAIGRRSPGSLGMNHGSRVSWSGVEGRTTVIWETYRSGFSR